MKFFKTKYLILLSFFIFTGIIIAKWSVVKYNIQRQIIPTHLKNEKTPLNKLLKKNARIAIVIDKGDYLLHIYTADTLVKSYPVVFGGNPVADKLQQGDECTPEGEFHIISKYPHKKWSKFIWLNYPTPDSWRKHNQAKKEGRISKNAKIGGQIGIHGVPKGTDFMIKSRINWTLGCISLTNNDVNEIYPFITKKTRITIQK